MSVDSVFDHGSLTLGEDPCLLGHITEAADDFFVAISETIDGIRDTNVFAKLHDELLRATQVVARDSRIQVVDCLELKPSVEEVEPLRTVDVHCCAKHSLREGLGDAEIGSAHGEVTEGDLHMDRHGHCVTDQEKGKAIPAGRDAFVHDAITEPGPEEDLTGQFEPPVPPRWAFLGAETKDDVFPAQAVEVEATKGQDRIVQVMLIVDHELGKGVISHDTLVVC